MVFSLSYPSIIKRQSAAPSVNSNSVLWRDTDDNTLYFSDGVGWQQFSSSSEAAGYEQMISQLAIEILRLSAEGVLTAPDYDNMFVDYIADADGQDGTIDTANTTATFNTNKYELAAGSENDVTTYTSSTGGAWQTALSQTGLNNLTVPNVTLEQNEDTSSQNVQSRVKFYYSDATDETTAQQGSIGSTYVEKTHTNPQPAKLVTRIDFQYYHQSGIAHRVRNCTYNYENTDGVIVQTNAQSLGFTPVYSLLHVKDSTLAASGALTYDISFDGGSTWDSTDNALDSKISVVDGSSKSMVVRINLEGDSGSDTTEIQDYEVLLWSS